MCLLWISICDSQFCWFLYATLVPYHKPQCHPVVNLGGPAHKNQHAWQWHRQNVFNYAFYNVWIHCIFNVWYMNGLLLLRMRWLGGGCKHSLASTLIPWNQSECVPNALFAEEVASMTTHSLNEFVFCCSSSSLTDLSVWNAGDRLHPLHRLTWLCECCTSNNHIVRHRIGNWILHFVKLLSVGSWKSWWARFRARWPSYAKFECWL